MKNNYVVIIAGGIGSRFWPESKTNFPKQFLDILGTGRTLIQSTFDRYRQIVPLENIFVVSIQEFQHLIEAQLPEILPQNILFEPERKNTAPCIAYATYKIGNLNPHANILIAPADHLILSENKFVGTIKESFEFVAKNPYLLTIGIQPSRPATGYGYIQYLDNETSKFKAVKTFTEKPDLALAKTFVQSGDFLWNSGIFLWNYDVFTKCAEENMPETAQLFGMILKDLNTPQELKSLKNVYSRLNSISIDYALMEKSKEVYVIPANFEWSDLGSWSSIYDLKEKDYLGNAVNGNLVKIYDASHNLILSQKDKLTIVEGIENKIVIDTEDVLMILSMDKEQEVKNITTDLKREKLDKFL